MSKSGTRAPNKMGSIRRRSDGRWEGRYTAPDGKQRSVYGKTQKEVATALRAAQHDIDTGSWMEPENMTMDEWFTIWLRDYQGHTTGRTVETYTAVIHKRMRPLFGSLRVSVLSTLHVRRLVSDMSKEGRSPSTIRHALAILSACMRCAVEAGLRRDNPVDGIKPPRPVKTSFTIIDRNIFPEFVAAAKETAVGNALIFLLQTGLRSGELRALRWSDVDFDTGLMRIERQMRQINVNDRRLEPPKDGGVRMIFITPETVDLLKKQRKAQAADRLAAGSSWKEDEFTADLIFRAHDGWNLGQLALQNAIKQLRVRLDLPDLRVHDLRHSYAVAALRSGIDVKTVQHNLGHKHASITLDTYAAYTEDAGRAAAEKLSAYWKDATK